MKSLKPTKATGINALRILAWLFLIVGTFMGGLIILNNYSLTSDNPIHNNNYLLSGISNSFGIAEIISGITLWALFLVICGIAESLIAIKKKMTEIPENKSDSKEQNSIEKN